MADGGDGAAAPPAYTQEGLEALLLEHFALGAFRASQLDAILATLEGHDSLVILPTGAGKSLTFQFPPFARSKPSFTVVISPLIALAKDQVGGGANGGPGSRAPRSGPRGCSDVGAGREEVD